MEVASGDDEIIDDAVNVGADLENQPYGLTSGTQTHYSFESLLVPAGVDISGDGLSGHWISRSS